MVNTENTTYANNINYHAQCNTISFIIIECKINENMIFIQVNWI